MNPAVVFAVAFGAYLAGHQIGDYWAQTSPQAMRKGMPGWAGRRACAAHVATYTLTLAAFLALATWQLNVPVNPAWAAAGLAVSAATHYYADRRTPLRRIAVVVRRGEFWHSGAAHLDQAWHWAWLFTAALITTGARL